MTKRIDKQSATYLRKSIKGDDHQVTSLESQEIETQKLTDRDNIEIPKENICIEQRSAGHPDDRPVLDELLHRVENGEINTIYTWEWSRLSRNPKDGGRVMQLIIDEKLKVVSPNGTFDKSNIMLAAINNAMSTEERQTLIRRIIGGIQTKVAEKGLCNWRAPIGYKNVGKIKGLKGIEQDHKIPLVVDLFYEALKNPSISYLRMHADHIGLMGATYKSIERSLSNHGVKSILTNPVYYGALRFKGKIIYPAQHKPAISKELWDSVQIAFQNRCILRPETKNLPYRRLIGCAECSSSVTAYEKKKKITYNYNGCSKRVRKDHGRCSQPAIRREELEKQFLKFMKKISIPEDWCLKGIKHLKERNTEQWAIQQKLTEKLQEEENIIQKRMDNLVTLRIDGEIDEERYKRLSKEYELTLESLQQRRENRDINSLDWLEQAEHLLKFVVNVDKIFELATTEEKEQLVRVIGWNLKLDNKKLVWEYRKPFSYIAEKESGKDWWS